MLKPLLRSLALLAAVAVPAIAAEPMPELTHGLDAPYAAPSIAGATSWINSPPLTNESLKGKVVLVDFWTYSCINCIRTFPYLKAWDAKYRDKGLTIIGVHSPEFAFEKDPKNVAQAVKRFGLPYPVALDSDMAIWRAFKNQYWPAHYLIDRQGRVVYTHFGEGDYDVTERNIQALLGDVKPGVKMEGDSPPVSSRGQSPETYLGSARAENYVSPEGVLVWPTQRAYSIPAQLEKNEWALAGSWDIQPEKIVSHGPSDALHYRFDAGKVFLVMGPAMDGKPVKVDVLLNGKPPGANVGRDGATITVDGERLYELLDFHGTPTAGLLELRPQAPGVQLYAFTFGL